MDLAPSLKPHQLERMINEIEVRRLYIGASLNQLVERYPGKPGTPAIKQILARLIPGGDVSRSDTEALLFSAILDSLLPRPRFNVRIQLPDGSIYEPDAAWSSPKTIVELDTRSYHSQRMSFDRDRERMRALSVAGWIVVPVTGIQVDQELDRVIADIGRVLAARSPTS